MSNNICLFTVIYPGCEPWLTRFFDSVTGQTRSDFDLMILNDGLTDDENLLPDLNGRIQVTPVQGTIAGVRQQGIDLLMDSGYEKIIFADADDYFSKNRIEKAAEALESVDIYVNDLTTVDDQENLITESYFSRRLGRQIVIEADFILRKNIMGLGNSAVRRSALRNINIPDDTIAVDWLIFTDMLLHGASALFRSDSVSYYRQHDQNTAGLKKITAEKIKHSLKVQIQNAQYFSEYSESHQDWLSELLSIQSALSESTFNLDQYIHDIESALPDYKFWWEEIPYLNEIIQNS